MKAPILVLCSVNNKWMTPEHAYSIKIGFADAEFIPVKFL